ncbi:putative motility protein [Heliobacterium undosum]|uniref:Putative motility protein n=1 Tax=Heliomicrobium undosum TaxID=121734 RepID=A0A845LDW4_9FIRM|nr:YjfB family protein [Heliomicrobium undosum]MZP31111.1 putative motility protein [Heliomicrobium undosum]
MNISQLPAPTLVNAASNGDIVHMLVLKKAMDMAQQQGSADTRMMEQSVNPRLGQRIDVRA